MNAVINESGPVILFILLLILYPFVIKLVGGIIVRIEDGPPPPREKHSEHRIESA